MIYYAGAKAHTAILQNINKSYIQKSLPSSWKKADIIPLSKQTNPPTYRPISLTSCLAKLAERMILQRLQWKIGPPHPNIYGFTPATSTSHAISTLLYKITSRPQTVSYLVFIDIEKAFEMANSQAILTLLARKEIKGNLL